MPSSCGDVTPEFSAIFCRKKTILIRATNPSFEVAPWMQQLTGHDQSKCHRVVLMPDLFKHIILLLLAVYPT
jgi:hypothetical protein